MKIGYVNTLFLTLSIAIASSCKKKENDPQPTPPPKVVNTPPSSFAVYVLLSDTTKAVIRWDHIHDADSDTIYLTISLNDSVWVSGLKQTAKDTTFTFKHLHSSKTFNGYVSATDRKSDPVLTPFTFTTKRYFHVFDHLNTPGALSSAFDIALSKDGGYILAGGPSLAKLDSNGVAKWRNLMPGNTNRGFQGNLISTRDGGYASVVGSSVQKFDGSGNNLWQQVTDVSVRAYTSVAETVDGNYLVGGQNVMVGGSLVKLDGYGNLIWQKPSGTVGIFNDIIASGDGNFFAGGNSDIFIAMKLDADGNILWSKTFPYLGSLIRVRTIMLKNGSVVFCVTTAPPPYYSYEVRLINLRLDGTLIWDKIVPVVTANCEQATPTSDGGLVFVGTDGVYLINALIVKVNSDGNLEWKKEFGDPKSLDYLWSFSAVRETKDRGFIIFGFKTYTYGGGESGPWILKTDDHGDY